MYYPKLAKFLFFIWLVCQGFICTNVFNPKQCIIPGDCFDYVEENKTFFSDVKDIYNRGTRYIESKVVADFIDALIGTYLSAVGELAAVIFLDWLGWRLSSIRRSLWKGQYIQWTLTVGWSIDTWFLSDSSYSKLLSCSFWTLFIVW